MSEIKPTLDRDLPILSEIAAKAGDPRLSALLLAASDDQVKQILEGRLKEGNLYVGALLSRQGERLQVVFSFRRADGQFGLLPLSVLAIVDLQERRVVKVVDYYLGERMSQLAPGELQPEMDLTRYMQEGPSGDRPSPQTLGNSQLQTWTVV
jgi:hypothetical protein